MPTIRSRSLAITPPRSCGFGDLPVLNHDTIAPARGSGSHGHDNMEIVTYVISGA